ncbi:MAG: hypothetical protein LIO99_15785 [Clostridiales bacterium]|nr:hypothetical protein [Clostridiales bacterium]
MCYLEQLHSLHDNGNATSLRSEAERSSMRVRFAKGEAMEVLSYEKEIIIEVSMEKEPDSLA